MADDKKLSPAYVSFTSLKSGVRNLLHDGSIPTQLDRSVLQSMSGSMRVQFVAALRFLGLIDKDDRPLPALAHLAAANDAEWKATFGEILKVKYPRQLAALKHGTAVTFRESFDSSLGASIVTPACRFLLQAAEDAGLPVSPHIKKAGIAGPKRRPVKAKDMLLLKGAEDEPDPPPPGDAKAALYRALLDKLPPLDPSESDPAVKKAWLESWQQMAKMIETLN